MKIVYWMLILVHLISWLLLNSSIAKVIHNKQVFSITYCPEVFYSMAVLNYKNHKNYYWNRNFSFYSFHCEPFGQIDHYYAHKHNVFIIVFSIWLYARMLCSHLSNVIENHLDLFIALKISCLWIHTIICIWNGCWIVDI